MVGFIASKTYSLPLLRNSIAIRGQMSWWGRYPRDAFKDGEISGAGYRYDLSLGISHFLLLKVR